MTGHGVSKRDEFAPSLGVVVDQLFFHRDDRPNFDADRLHPRAGLDVEPVARFLQRGAGQPVPRVLS